MRRHPHRCSTMNEPRLLVRQEMPKAMGFVGSTERNSSASRSSTTGPRSTRLHPSHSRTSNSSHRSAFSSIRTRSSSSSHPHTSTTTHPPQPTPSDPNDGITAKVGPGVLNVTLPGSFTQCLPAYLNITALPDQPVSVTVVDYHNILQRLDVLLPAPVTGWYWDAVDFPAGTQLRVEFATGQGDVGSDQWANWVGLAQVHRGTNVTTCLDAED